jgi:hypothetical protein
MKASANTEIKSGPRGTKVVTSSGRDDSSCDIGQGKESFTGGKMGGSATNLSHSLEGASAVQHVKGK